MKKRLLAIFLAATLVLFFAGCDRTGKTDESGQPSEKSTPIEVWEELHGSFVREDSSQYNNAVLFMKYLSNNCAMFEFRLVEGSEEEDLAHDTLIYGVLIVDDGKGTFETIPDAFNPFTINFSLSEDGQRIIVTHSGDLSISPDGEYLFTDANLEVSSLSANTIIEHLPTASTSLNSTLGAYTINYPDALVSDWFYIVEVTFDDTGAVLAKFAIAKDLSAVFRIDDDIEPALIFGSAQPMMDAEIYILQEDEDAEELEESELIGEPNYEAQPLVFVELDSGIVLTPGATGKLIPLIPYELPYTLTATSTENSIATVDENGLVTAVSLGEATISGTLTVEDGTKEFSIDIIVEEASEQDDVEIIE